MKHVFFILFFIMIFCFSNFCSAQSFQRLFGTTRNDSFSSMILLPNGDYIVTGTIVRVGAGTDIYIARIDSSGLIVWENTYGGIGNEDNSISCLNSNGNIAIAATSSSYNGNRDLDIFLFEINTSGLLIWSRSYGKGTTVSRLDEIPKKINLSPTGLVLCATIGSPSSTSPDALAFEISNNGRTINWQNQININSGFGDIPSSIISSRNGGYIMVGGSFSTRNNYDQVIWRLSASGVLQSNIAYGSMNNENAQDLFELPNNDIIVMGNFRGFSGLGLEFSLCCINVNDRFNWIRTYGDNGSRDERAYGFTKTSNGYAFCGYTNALPDNDILLVWTDTLGRMIGNTSIGNSGKEESSMVVQNSNGSFTIAGVSNSAGAGMDDCYILKTNQKGDVVNNCSSYRILERSITASIRVNNYLESNPQLLNSPITLMTTVSSLNDNNLSCTSLPLELLDFQVLNYENSNMLSWVSLNEIDVSHFEIQKSIDALSWESIKLVESKGGIGQTINYSYADFEKHNLCCYYRLKEVDYSGSYSYSKIIKKCSDVNEIYIYPNPTEKSVSVKGLKLDENKIIYLSVKNLDGVEVFRQTFNENSTSNELLIDLNNLNAGLYMLSLTCKENTFLYRIIKE